MSVRVVNFSFRPQGINSHEALKYGIYRFQTGLTLYLVEYFAARNIYNYNNNIICMYTYTYMYLCLQKGRINLYIFTDIRDMAWPGGTLKCMHARNTGRPVFLSYRRHTLYHCDRESFGLVATLTASLVAAN